MANRTELKLFDAAGGSTFAVDTFAPRGVRGPEKVANRVVYALLTRRGTVPGRPEAGSDFLAALDGMRSEFDVYAAFAAAQGQVRTTVEAAQEDDEDGSERYGDVRLTDIKFSGDAIELTVALIAKDGSRPSNPARFTLNL